MTKLFSRKFFILFISACLAGTGILLACADGDDDYGNSSFAPEAFADSVYSPFFYSQMFYYGIGHDNEHDSRFNDANVNDWYVYFDSKVRRRDLDYLLDSASAPGIDSAAAWVSGKQPSLPNTLKDRTLFLPRTDGKTGRFLSYLSLAKQCEVFALNNHSYESWDYDPKTAKKPVFDALRISQSLQHALSVEKDPFLQERYWFQLERFNFFNASPQKTLDVFDARQGSFPKNTLYYRAMAYAAGAYYKLKNFSKANYYYSRVYDGSNLLKTVAHYSFHPQEEADWNKTLALCASNDERVTLWQMLGVFYSDEKRAIQAIYALNPKSDKLDLLLTRLVNLSEQEFNPIAGVEPTNSKIAYKDSAIALVSHIADAGNTDKPYMWQIAAGYLSMLDKHYYKAKTYYALAEKTLPSQPLVRMQLRLLKAVNTLGAATKVDGKLEQELLPDLQWLRGIHYNDQPAFRYDRAFLWMKSTLSKKYALQKEILKAICFSNNPAFYGDARNVEAMKGFLEKAGKTPYEQLCADVYIMKKNDLLQYQSVRLAYNDQLPDAIAKMEQAGDNALAVLPGNPFNGRIQDCHDCDHEAAQKIKYTRLSLLQKMKEMEDKVAAGQDSYTNAALLGNAFYNISHYGNARAFYEGAVIGEGHYSPFAIDSVFKDFLIDMRMAVKYYTLALQAAQTDEQKAKCNWMLAKCQRNQWYNEHFFNDTKNDYDADAKTDFSFLPAYKAMKSFSNTQYYKEVIKECGYFRTYSRKPGN